MASAKEAVNGLTKHQITELKSLAKPPEAVEHVCVAIMHLVAGIDPDVAVPLWLNRMNLR